MTTGSPDGFIDRAKAGQRDVAYTQRMTMHLNGGDKFSELHYRIYADGKPTNVTRHTRTNGSPQYLKTADEFHAGEETFDVLATKGVGMEAWLKQHAKPETVTP